MGSSTGSWLWSGVFYNIAIWIDKGLYFGLGLLWDMAVTWISLPTPSMGIMDFPHNLLGPISSSNPRGLANYLVP